MRHRLFQESRARNCQTSQELRRFCCEETDRARQLTIDQLSLQQERNPSTVRQLLTQAQDLQNTVNSLTDAKVFYDPETASSSRTSHVPSQPLNIPSPKSMLHRDSGLPLDTRNTVGTSGNVSESLPPAREGPSSALFENSLNLASSSCGLGPGNTGNIIWNMEEEWDESRRTPRFNQGIGTLNPLNHNWWNLFSRWYDWGHEMSNLGNASRKVSRLSIYAYRMMTFKIFDTRWDQALLAFWTKNTRNNEPPSYSRSKTTVRRHIDQTMRTRNFRARNEIVESGAVNKSQKGKKAYVERKVTGRHMDNVSWTSVWKQTRSETRRTIVLSCTKSAGTDWRKDTLKKFRPQRRKSFWKKRQDSVQTFP